ncbi:MAG: M28 family peptidase [Haliscomenobacter sp.]
MKPFRVAGFIFLLAVAACQNDKKADAGSAAENGAAETAVAVPRFDRDSAHAFVAAQLDFGPRVPNTAGHRACREWLVAKMQGYGAVVIEQRFSPKAYTGTTLEATNIIAQYNPENPQCMVIVAHWDSRPFSDSPLHTGNKNEPVMGADDGASGVAVLLEVARQLQANPIGIGVDLLLLDAEDYGDNGGGAAESWGMGAQYWAKNLHYTNGVRPMYGILLDMVGGKGARFGQEYFSLQYAGPVVQKIWKLAQSMGYSHYFVNEQTNPVTDDHYFVNTIARIPMVDIINQPPDSETGFPAHWHTDKDNLAAIDRFTLGAVGQLMLAVIYREENGSL